MSSEVAMKREDHRVRVAAERRERMRARLSEAALLVFGERGVDGSVIDETIRAAGVARGTFYNYYRSNEELLAAVARDAGDDMMRVIDPVVRNRDDPAARVAAGVRLWLELARAHPHLAAFFRRAGGYAVDHNMLVREYLPRDLAAGIASGRFRTRDPRLAFDLVVGPVLAAMTTLLDGDVGTAYGEELAEGILRSLGLVPDEAAALAREQLREPTLPSDSLIARAGALSSAERPDR